MQIKKIKNIFQTETKQVKWKINLLRDRLEQFKKKTKVISKWAGANRENGESYTKSTRANHKNAKPIAGWTWANRENETY